MLKQVIGKFLPPEEQKFFTLFDLAAKKANQAAEVYFEIIKNQLPLEKVDESIAIKHESAEILHQSLVELNNTFITPIERDDILQLSMFLNKITKRITRSCVNLKLYKFDYYPDILHKQGQTLILATRELITGIDLLKKKPTLKMCTESYQRMQKIEHEGDEILVQAIEELFSGEFDPLSVIKYRDIYKTVESAMDKCQSVSDMVVHIILKQS